MLIKDGLGSRADLNRLIKRAWRQRLTVQQITPRASCCFPSRLE